MPKRRVDEDVPISFGDAAAAAEAPQEAPARPSKGAGRQRRGGSRGPTPTDDSLAARIERGEASHLHGIIDVKLHRQLKVLAVMEGRTLSEVIEAAVREYIDRHR